MSIQTNSVVAIDYTLKNDAGQVIDSSQGKQPLHYLHGHGNIVPGLEEALTGKAAGDALAVSVPPEKGYGTRDEKRVFDVPRDKMPPDLKLEVGIQLAMQTKDGQTVPLTVASVQSDKITVDANHALAGKALHFDVQVREVRDATAEELTHGHVHGAGGVHG